MTMRLLKDLDEREDSILKVLSKPTRGYETINENRREVMENMKRTLKEKKIPTNIQKKAYKEEMKRLHLKESEMKYEMFNPKNHIEATEKLRELRDKLKHITKKRHEAIRRGDVKSSKTLREEKETLYATYLKMLKPMRTLMSSARAESAEML